MVLYKLLGRLGRFFGAAQGRLLQGVHLCGGLGQSLLHTGAHSGGFIAGLMGGHAQKRLGDQGLGAQAQFRLQDDRDISDAPFDAICSIEMIEAVGQAYWPTYFETVARLLKPGGRACIQSIVIADSYFDRYVRGTDFIQQYIFPGGCLPSPSAFRQQAQAAGLRVVDEFAFGVDYAHTLRVWRERFMQVKPQVLALGFDERFVRIWQFYLAYCEAAFMEANTDVVQYTLLKP